MTNNIPAIDFKGQQQWLVVWKLLYFAASFTLLYVPSIDLNIGYMCFSK